MRYYCLIAVSFVLLTVLFMDRVLRYEYDPITAARYATQHAENRSKKLCGYAVRQAINAGGCPTFGYPGAACDYMDFLPGLGFTEISKSDKLTVGDIVVFEAVNGHPHGHMAIWNGLQWISDFRQESIIVNRAYDIENARYFRLIPGKHKRKLFAR